MAYCRARKKLSFGGELNCDLDENHEPILNFHYDKVENTEWRDGRVPAAVPASPVKPPKRMVARKAIKVPA